MKKLKREKFKLPVGSGNIFGYFCLLALLIVTLVVTVLYVPSTPEKGGDKTSDKYGAELDDELLNNSSIRCESKISKELVKGANKISVTYTFDPVVDTELSQYEWCGIDETDECYIEEYYEQYDAFRLDFTNIPNDVEISVSNSVDDEIVYITPDLVRSGSFSFKNTNVDKIVNYKAEIRSTVNECAGDIIRVFDFNLPMLNMNYFTRACENNDDPKCALVSYDALSETAYTAIDVGKPLFGEDTENEANENKKKGFKIEFSWRLVIIISLILLIFVTIDLIVFIVIQEKRKKALNEKI